MRFEGDLKSHFSQRSRLVPRLARGVGGESVTRRGALGIIWVREGVCEGICHENSGMAAKMSNEERVSPPYHKGLVLVVPDCGRRDHCGDPLV